ncbi:pentapeptide repeat-containing protein [Mycobacterium sp. AT1]|uniref:pentapeptide repeat-containing protein n=1 Tax=Mycobacterium sp. AT1 TaxID=1961706 RepID=UPI0018E95581|nr:pentapeptide repeat-containing protein [Mycobacterium sp. AT1]
MTNALQQQIDAMEPQRWARAAKRAAIVARDLAHELETEVSDRIRYLAETPEEKLVEQRILELRKRRSSGHPGGTPGTGLDEPDTAAGEIPNAAGQLQFNVMGGVLDAADSFALSDLSGADLRGARLAGADLRGADLSGANLTGADLTGIHVSDPPYVTAEVDDGGMASLLSGDSFSQAVRYWDPAGSSSVSILGTDAYRELLAARWAYGDHLAPLNRGARVVSDDGNWELDWSSPLQLALRCHGVQRWSTPIQADALVRANTGEGYFIIQTKSGQPVWLPTPSTLDDADDGYLRRVADGVIRVLQVSPHLDRPGQPAVADTWWMHVDDDSDLRTSPYYAALINLNRVNPALAKANRVNPSLFKFLDNLKKNS